MVAARPQLSGERLHANPRRGYALIVVLMFLILLFALWSMVYRTTSSLLRIETNRVLQQTRCVGVARLVAQVGPGENGRVDVGDHTRSRSC